MSPTKTARLLERICWMLTQSSVKDLDLLVCLGQAVHQRMLSELFVLGSEEGNVKRLNIGHEDELLLFTGLLPLMRADLRQPISPTALATDASPTGAGACRSTSLTPKGVAFLDGSALPVERQELLLIALGDEFGSSLRALELVNLTPAGTVMVDSRADSRRDCRDRFPGCLCLQYTTVEGLRAEMKHWSTWFLGARKVLLLAWLGEDALRVVEDMLLVKSLAPRVLGLDVTLSVAVAAPISISPEVRAEVALKAGGTPYEVNDAGILQEDARVVVWTSEQLQWPSGYAVTKPAFASGRHKSAWSTRTRVFLSGPSLPVERDTRSHGFGHSSLLAMAG
jgi:hypothetical protein